MNNTRDARPVPCAERGAESSLLIPTSWSSLEDALSMGMPTETSCYTNHAGARTGLLLVLV